MPSSVSRIAQSAFFNNSTIAELYIPSSVTYIGPVAFRRMSGITDIYIYGAPELDQVYGKPTGYYKDHTHTVHCTSGSVQDL